MHQRMLGCIMLEQVPVILFKALDGLLDPGFDLVEGQIVDFLWHGYGPSFIAKVTYRVHYHTLTMPEK